MNQDEVEKVYDTAYFKLNKILLITTGLWPYRSQNEKFICRMTVYVVMSLILLPNANAVRIWCGKNFSLCGENIVGCMYSIVIILKYTANIFSESRITSVHKQVAKNWIYITNTNEKSILTNYAIQGKILTIIYIVYMSLAGLAFSQATILPVILDLIMPLNESREKILIIRAEFGFDPFEYYYQLYTAYCIATVISVTVFMSIDSTYAAIVQQNLGILSIVQHRLHVATEYYDKNKDKDVAYDIVIEAILLHKEALQFVDLIESSYHISFLFIIGCSILAISLGGVLITEQIGQTLEMTRMAIGLVGVFIHCFYLSYPGQQLLDHTSDIFLNIYLSKWYLISHKAKTLLKVMMLRCMKPSIFTAGKLYVMNYENYGSIIKSTLSYITVLASFKD